MRDASRPAVGAPVAMPLAPGSLFAYDLRPGTGPVKEYPGDRPKILPPKRDRERIARAKAAASSSSGG